MINLSLPEFTIRNFILLVFVRQIHICKIDVLMVICQMCYSLKLIEKKCSAQKKPGDNTQIIFSQAPL